MEGSLASTLVFVNQFILVYITQYLISPASNPYVLVFAYI